MAKSKDLEKEWEILSAVAEEVDAAAALERLEPDLKVRAQSSPDIMDRLESLAEVSNDAKEQIRGKLHALAFLSLGVLYDILNSEEASPSVKARAADSVLKMAGYSAPSRSEQISRVVTEEEVRALRERVAESKITKVIDIREEGGA